MASISSFFLADIEHNRIRAIVQRLVFFVFRFLCPGIPYRTIRYQEFSHDLKAAELAIKNNKTAAMLVTMTMTMTMTMIITVSLFASYFLR